MYPHLWGGVLFICAIKNCIGGNVYGCMYVCLIGCSNINVYDESADKWDFIIDFLC